MAYTATNWVEGVTTLGPTNMNKIEAGIATVAGIDQLASGQQIKWAGDTNLYRSAAGVLQSDSQFVVSNQAGLYVNNTSTAGWVLRAQIAGDTTVKFRLGADGAMSWGPGGGVGVDTNLYRSAASILKTDGSFYVGADSYAQAGTAYQVRIGNTSGYASLAFGSTFDTILYRVGASTLQTDTFLKVLGAGAGVAAPNVSGLMLNFYGLGSRWIEMGATDSGGAGYKMLRIAN